MLKRARISMQKFRQILKYFSLDIEATKIAQLTGLNRNTVNKYLLLIRKRIAEACELESPFSGDIEVDESFFGARQTLRNRMRLNLMYTYSGEDHTVEDTEVLVITRDDPSV